MTRQIVIHKWHHDKPQVNQIVWVWDAVYQVRAIWTGTEWRTPDGVTLTDIECWRPLRD